MTKFAKSNCQNAPLMPKCLQKPYRCEVVGCSKRYTDPSSLRKHVKSHSQEEQLQYRRSKEQLKQANNNEPSSSSSWHLDGGGDSNPSSTLLAVGLQAGGTVVQQTTSSVDKKRGASVVLAFLLLHSHYMLVLSAAVYQGLAHEPSSLDDLDADAALPFDDVPVRYDSTGENF